MFLNNFYIKFTFYFAIFFNFTDILSSYISISYWNIEMNYFVYNNLVNFSNFLYIKAFLLPLFMYVINYFIYKYDRKFSNVLIIYNVLFIIWFLFLTIHNLSISF